MPLEGWENIDIKNGKNAYPLNCQDDSVDIIRASHLLEHFSNAEVFDVIKDWASKLKVGGKLMIAVPDFRKVVNGYINKEEMNVSGYIMGGQSDKDDFHKSIYDRDSLCELMKSVGLDDIKEWKSDINDCASLPISLNLEGTKKQVSNVRRKVKAVMSIPRLCFSDNINCIMTEIVSRGIQLKKGTGVFWSQVLARMMEEAIKEDCDYVLTIDYDTWFRYEHVNKILALMEKYPDADAICPVQMKRECDSPLMCIKNPDGSLSESLTYAELEKDLLPIHSGHFGLTVFRASSLRKLVKPWFVGIPNKDGDWGDGRIDDDIYFWENFKKCGLKSFMANKVQVGHIQLMCTFPGHYKDSFKCIHAPLGDLGNVEKIPEHCRAY